MKRLLSCLFLFFFLANLTVAQSGNVVISSEKSLIPAILSGDLEHELVQLEGFIVKWDEIPKSTTSQYWLRDYWGYLIPVMTTTERPDVNKAYKVVGTIQYSKNRFRYSDRTTRYFIAENSREAVSDEFERDIEETPQIANDALSAIETAQSEISDYSDTWYYDLSEARNRLASASSYYNQGNYNLAIQEANAARELGANPDYSSLFYLAILLLILIIVVIGVIIYLLTKKSGGQKKYSQKREPDYQQPPTTKYTETRKTPEPEQVGHTVKMHVAPPETLKILKGRFQITEGETELNEIRFYLLPGNNSSMEYSFGRNPGKPYEHVQINHQTISKDQARILYNSKSGEYTLINKADPQSKNATRINDAEMQMNESKKLNDGDKITMGIVNMIYRDN